MCNSLHQQETVKEEEKEMTVPIHYCSFFFFFEGIIVMEERENYLKSNQEKPANLQH